jgi:hypothetical protein
MPDFGIPVMLRLTEAETFGIPVILRQAQQPYFDRPVLKKPGRLSMTPGIDVPFF